MYVFEYACVRGSERVLSVTGTVVDLDRVVGWNGGSQLRPGSIQDRECMLVLTAWTS